MLLGAAGREGDKKEQQEGRYCLSFKSGLILNSPLKSLPFSAKALRVCPVVIKSGAKDKAAFLKEGYIAVEPDGT